MNQYRTTSMSGLAESEVSMRHSGLGVTSFVIACVGGLGMVVVFVIAGVLENSTPGGMDEESVSAVLVGLAMIGLTLGLLLAAILGIVSLFQGSRKKLFGILGLCISGVMVALFVSLLVIGLMME